MIIGFTEDTGWRRVSFPGDHHGLAQRARSRQMNLNSSKHHILHGDSKIWLQMYSRMEGGSFLLKESSIGICGVLQQTKIMSSWVELMRYKVQNKKVIVPSYVGQTTLRMQVFFLQWCFRTRIGQNETDEIEKNILHHWRLLLVMNRSQLGISTEYGREKTVRKSPATRF